ncbi:ribosomal protein L7/L12 [Sphingopyxis sp.]|uniref:ribosomal protein L7/L12 n=1 Tax=Sphingopyxis sp. TaxID=1908224 RepID=UPI002B477C96|nr:ribosomal protein L7/L12 [Sphingopyxis sp.]HJS09839.1 ribosomal protein L7/L12 [Sphingopyxis sp.]
MSGLLLFALGFLCGAGLILALRRNSGARDLMGPPPRAVPRPPSPSPAHSVEIGDTPGKVHVRTEVSSDDQILDLIRRGRKIEAIKRMRELTGMRLSEAKDAVEAIEATLR